MNPVACCGILVGGKSRRMGGYPKGLLSTPDGTTILARTIRLAQGLACEVLLLGCCAAYDGFGLTRLPDAMGGEGPLSGIVSLLEYAQEGAVIVMACDLPFVSEEVLGRLATYRPEAKAVAPRENGMWNAVFARYRVEAALPCGRSHLAQGTHAMWALLDHLDAEPLPLSGQDRWQLRDWDCPEDMR